MLYCAIVMGDEKRKVKCNGRGGDVIEMMIMVMMMDAASKLF